MKVWTTVQRSEFDNVAPDIWLADPEGTRQLSEKKKKKAEQKLIN